MWRRAKVALAAGCAASACSVLSMHLLLLRHLAVVVPVPLGLLVGAPGATAAGDSSSSGGGLRAGLAAAGRSVGRAPGLPMGGGGAAGNLALAPLTEPPLLRALLALMADGSAALQDQVCRGCPLAVPARPPSKAGFAQTSCPFWGAPVPVRPNNPLMALVLTGSRS